jgi:DNA repair protein RadC
MQLFKLTWEVRESNVDYTITNDHEARSVILNMCDKFLDYPIETFSVFALTSQNRVIGYTEFEGWVDSCSVPMQKVFSFLLSVGASAFIVAHNHPGGSRDFSQADIDITSKIHAAGKLLNVNLIDHILICGGEHESFRNSIHWSKL